MHTRHRLPRHRAALTLITALTLAACSNAPAPEDTGVDAGADAFDVADATDVVDVVDATDATDATDARDVVDVVDVVGVHDVVDVIDVVDVHDVVDVVDVVEAGCGNSAADCGAGCVDLSSDVRHCGACGNDCTVLPGVRADAVTCVAGACVLAGACADGRADCTGGAADGCETDVTTAAHCGGCGTACSEPTPVCSPADGGSYACASGCSGATPTRCAMTCVDTQADLAHCGGCDQPCVAPTNASAVCSAGACDFACDAGFHRCGDHCAADDSLAECGAACAACAAPVNASAVCSAGACDFACDAGYARVAGACVAVAAPRPIAPLSTATVSSRRPTLRWQLAPGTDGARVEVCRDRACTTVIASFDASGTSGAPSVDLPAGVVFWRLRGRIGATAGTAVSPVWEFTVGARTAAVDTSWGTTLDVNGDGYADVAVGANSGNVGTGRVDVYLGGRGGLATTPAAFLGGPDPGLGNFGYSVASAGDVNGDGYADLVVGASGANSNAGRAHVYLGGSGGLAVTPAVSLSGPDGANGQFGYSVASAGDVNGDGYADVVVGAYYANTGAGKAYLYLGGSGGLAATPALSLASPDGAGANFGVSVASAGDVNGDGYADVVVGAHAANSVTGRAHLFLGGVAGLAATPAVSLTGRDGAGGQFGISVASAGDVNGDGYADVVVGAAGASSQTGAAYVYLGGLTGLASVPGVSLTGPDGAGGNFGRPVAGAGDVNGDGYADVVVGAAGASSQTGAAYVYLGGIAGLANAPSVSLPGRDGAGAYFGVSVAGAGDVDGDGSADVVVGAYRATNGKGRAYVYAGSPAGLGTAPVVSLPSPDPYGGQFGICVASAADGSGPGQAHRVARRSTFRARIRPVTGDG